MDGWGITNVIRPDTSQRRGRINVSISRDMVDDATQAHYWILPAEYLGNKVCIHYLASGFKIMYQ